jgi:selenocysteine lyase/cysteine desulfurase
MKGEKNTKPTTAYDVSPGGFQAYEHQWAMGAAFRFHEAIGRKRVAGRIRELNDQLKRGLATVPSVRVVTPTDASLSAGIVCFEIAGVTPEAAQEKLLAKKVVASASPYLPSYVRLAPSLVNTPEEVDAAVKAVRQLAGA